MPFAARLLQPTSLLIHQLITILRTFRIFLTGYSRDYAF
jgi:hypothetical protein